MKNRQPGSHTSDKERDLPDSVRDRKSMKQEETIINLPDVKDIPGQEYVRPPRIQEMEDTTIASAGEEGKGVFDEIGDQEIASGFNSNISRDEIELLEEATDTVHTDDELALKRAMIDQKDDDGDLLNEAVDVSGSDLDVPGSEDDDANEEIGEEDEENNFYSQSDNRDE